MDNYDIEEEIYISQSKENICSINSTKKNSEEKQIIKGKNTVQSQNDNTSIKDKLIDSTMEKKEFELHFYWGNYYKERKDLEDLTEDVKNIITAAMAE